MSLLLRSSLFSRALQPQLVGLQGMMSPRVLSRPVTMNVQKAKVTPIEDYDLHNIKIGRPQSPHLTIYAFQVTSMLSISHRITGMALSSYMMALGIGYLALPNDITHYLTMLESMQLSTPLLCAAKFLVAFPLCYHWANGIRHLLWDTGRFLSIKGVYSTGYAMLAVSTVLTAIIMAL